MEQPYKISVDRLGSQPRVAVKVGNRTAAISNGQGELLLDKALTLADGGPGKISGVLERTLHWYGAQTIEKNPNGTKTPPKGIIAGIEGDPDFKAAVVAYAGIHKVQLGFTPEPSVSFAASKIVTRYNNVSGLMAKPMRPMTPPARQPQVISAPAPV